MKKHNHINGQAGCFECQENFRTQHKELLKKKHYTPRETEIPEPRYEESWGTLLAKLLFLFAISYWLFLLIPFVLESL